MAVGLEKDIIDEFMELDITVPQGSVLDRLTDLSQEYSLTPSNLCDEWVAFSQQNGECGLEVSILERFEGALRTKSRKTPLSRRTASKTKGGGVKMHTKEDLSSMFADQDNDLLDLYATPEDSERFRSQKRMAEQTTPTTPANKMRPTQNGATPISSRPHPPSNRATPTNGHTHNGTPVSSPSYTPMGSTPAGRYSQRGNSGHVLTSLNDCTVPVSWRSVKREVVARQLGESPLRKSEHYMFQKVTEKAFALMDRIEEFGKAVCAHSGLPEPLSLGQHSLEPAVFTGQVVCEGEGHLNAHSCLLEGPVGRTRTNKGVCVQMSIPDNVSCFLFPGQVIAVEGINNLHGQLHPSRIYDEGVPPPPPTRKVTEIKGLTLMAAAGPFTTSDNLDMEPLRDLLSVVERSRPDVLILLGPFVDASHQHIKSCQLPGDMTFSDFFIRRVLDPVRKACADRSKVILIPSQRDIHHPYSVYPQPPLVLSPTRGTPHSYSDPSTLSLNGVCVGLTSTDVLFHLSGRTMARGHVGDRMARIAGHILQQRCYYPLLPAFRRDDHTTTSQPPGSRETPTRPSSTNQTPVTMETDEETTEVNMNLIDAFENGHALLPLRPDLLLLPSDLKPFIKVLHGCICVNPGRLTKRATGGTFMKAIVPDIAVVKTDLSSHIGVELVHI